MPVDDAFHANPFLARGYAPQRREFDCAELRVEGRWPAELAGVFYRIGPNPQFEPRTPYNPLMGDGMVHAFRVEGGRVGYRNRWVRTGRWTRENAAGRALFATAGLPTDDDTEAGPRPADGVANTNLVWHGGRLLALEEGAGPVEIDPDTLETRGPWTFEGRLPRNMTAHPKVDPRTGAMLFFANLPRGRLTGELALFEADASGRITAAHTVQGPYPALVHDFAITERFVVVGVFPVTLSLERAQRGAPVIAFEPETASEILVTPRAGGVDDVRRFAGPPCMAWHVLNAFEAGDRIVLDLCEQDVAMFPTPDGAPPDTARTAQRLVRWEMDWNLPGPVARRRLSDLICEYPRIDERRTGRRHRYGYVACCGGPGTDDIFHRGVARIDVSTGETAVWPGEPGFAAAEPVFVPRSAQAAEGDGWILTNLYNEAADASCLAMFDAAEIPAGPIARAWLDHRVPVGFHATWRGLSAR
jgi:carotenoid cleavage dioxygenase-like enzyme